MVQCVYTINGVSNTTGALHCTCTTTIQHNEPLMWSETYSYYKTGLRPAEYGFGRGLGLAGFVLGLGLVKLLC